MTETEVLWKALDTAQWELSEALKNLPDDDVWKRPDPRLLSVGEQIAHVLYWETHTFLDGFESPLLAHRADYYPHVVGKPAALAVDAATVESELMRGHEACKSAFHRAPVELDAKNPYREGWIWRDALVYQAFHIAYHAGQIYSVRHLLGHETVDN